MISYKIMGIFSFLRQKSAVSDKKQEEVKKTQITKLTKSIYDQRIDFLKDKLERIKQKHQALILEDQIADLEDDMEDDNTPDDLLDGTSSPQPTEDTLMSNILNFGTQALMNRKASPSNAGNVSPLSNSALRTYSDEEIKSIIANTPPDVLKQIKGLPDGMLKNILRNQYKDADDITIYAAIPLIKNS